MNPNCKVGADTIRTLIELAMASIFLRSKLTILSLGSPSCARIAVGLSSSVRSFCPMGR
jgi:hypothetical protein